MCAAALNTMLMSPDFEEHFEHEKVLNFSRDENNHAMSVFKHQNSQHLAYPGIFCRKPRADTKDRCVPVYCSDIICKSEFRHSDRRVAQCMENIFFKLKKIARENNLS